MKRFIFPLRAALCFLALVCQYPTVAAGFFQGRPDVNHIALSTESHRRREQVFQIIFHEYTHLLLKSRPSASTSPSTPSGPEVIVGETVVSEPYDASSQLREALRRPAAGETQIMAKLVRIECEVKNIFFVLQTPSEPLRLRTASFEGIQITTFSPDVTGEISCGPRKPENVVVVCYIPTTDKRVKAVGVLKSVEFVPADFKLKPDKQ